MTDHDGLYHRLFSHKLMTQDLAREFIDPTWLENLDLDQMTRENVKFQGEKGKRRQGDIIWRIPGREGTDFYLALFLEFQSQADRWMALRIMVYVGLFWQQLIAEKRLTPGGKLPPVLPLVIYNGDPRWKKPLTLRELIELPEGSPLWEFQPHARYHVIDEGAYSAEELAQQDSLNALLFRLEHCREPKDLLHLVDDLIEWFSAHPDFERMKSLFGELTGQAIGKMGKESIPLSTPEELLEVRTMLSTRVEEWERNLILEGERKGEIRGVVKAFLLVLRERFGSILPNWVDAEIEQADEEKLTGWMIRVLKVDSLDELFGR